MSTRILLADDHAVVRKGLRALLAAEPDLEVVGEAETGVEAVQLAQRLRPDLVLMDLLLPELDGIAATERIRNELPATQVVVLTSVVDDTPVINAMRAGAIGYVLKDTRLEVLLETIRAGAKGEVQLSPTAAAGLLRGLRAPAHPQELTPREREILRSVALGRTNKEVAATLRIAETTVKTHVSTILAKLGAHSRTQATLHAVRLGLVSPDEMRVVA